MFLVEDGVVGTQTWLALYTGAPTNMPVLRKVTSGEAVEQLQQTLLLAGFEVGLVDGYFGRVTQSGVAGFQRQMGLKDDGIVGPSTWHALSKVRLENPLAPIQAFTLHNNQKIHVEEITDIAVASSTQRERRVVTASRDTFIRFSEPDGTPIHDNYGGDFGAVSSVAIHPTKQQIISATFGGTIRVANYEDRKNAIGIIFEQGHVFPARGGGVTDIAIEPTGQYIAATTSLNAARIFNFKGDLLRELFNAEESLYNGQAESVVFNPRKEQLATASSNGGAILWNRPLEDNADGVNLSSARLAHVVCFSPNGYKLAVGQGPLLQIYASPRLAISNHRFPTKITALAFNPTGRYIAVGCHNSKVYIFDLQAEGGKGKIVFELLAHNAPVTAVAFGKAPAQRLYSGDREGRLLTWTVNTYDAAKQVLKMGEASPTGEPSAF